VHEIRSHKEVNDNGKRVAVTWIYHSFGEVGGVSNSSSVEVGESFVSG